MKELFSTKNAGYLLLLVFGVVFVFHLLIILGVYSTQNIWGGSVPHDQLIYFELVALLLLLFFSWVTAIKAEILNRQAPRLILNSGPWIVFTYLLINTVGNLFSPGFEKLFALVTFVLAVCAFKVAIHRPIQT